METLILKENKYQIPEEDVNQLLNEGLLTIEEGDLIPNIEPPSISLEVQEEQEIKKEWQNISWEVIKTSRERVLDPEDSSGMAGVLTGTVEVTQIVKSINNEVFKDFEQFFRKRRNEMIEPRRKEAFEKARQRFLKKMEPFRVENEEISLPSGFRERPPQVKKEIEGMIGKSLKGKIGGDGEELIYVDEEKKVKGSCSEDIAEQLL